MTANDTINNPDDVAKKGEEIYSNKLKFILEPKENEKFVAIDVVSGEYFLGSSILEALEKARKEYPDRVFHTIKVGYQGVFKMGGYAKNGFQYGWNT